MRKVFTPLLLAVLSLCGTQLKAQQVSASIATWKNNAKGAYTLIHDDYGDPVVDGIWQYADTMASNRGIKFTFGAITSSCESPRWVGSTQYDPYAKAQEMIGRGHEIISHSHTHTCAVFNEWCVDKGWAEAGQEDFATEIDHCTESIESGTGVRPRYYIFPYDLHNLSANARLKQQGYIGSRTAWGDTMSFDGYEANDVHNFRPDIDGYFRTSVQVFDNNDANLSDAGQTNVLNSEVDNAIAYNQWANRELHNVGSSGWGHVTVQAYADHLDYVKQKMASGDLWVGTVSEILTYQVQKLHYVPSANYESANGQIVVDWNTPSLNIANYLSPLVVKCPITINVDISNLVALDEITQGGQTITDFTISGNTVSFNVFPHEGVVYLKEPAGVGCPEICIAQQPLDKTLDEGQEFTLSVSAYSDTEANLTYQWYFDGQAISGATSSTFTVDPAEVSHSGEYQVYIAGQTHDIWSDPVEVVVNEVTGPVQEPFFGTPLAIPGQIEVEDYDKGGEGLAFHEINNPWDPATNPYRQEGSAVDIGLDGGIYSVGWIVGGEWLEYTVDIEEDGLYDFVFRTASAYTANPPEISVYLDGSLVIPAFECPQTNSWETYADTEIQGIDLPKGQHVLRLYFNEGDLGIDYFKVSKQFVEPTVDFAADVTTLYNCQGVTFTANVTGDASSYEWDFGAGAIPQSATGIGPHTVTYSTTGNKTVSLTVDGTYSETKSAYVQVSQNPDIVPSLTIAATSQDICQGETVSFSISSEEYVGSAPTYQWKVNGVNQGTGNSFSASDFSNGDEVTCVVTSNEACASTTTTTSNELVIFVNQSLTPSVSINADKTSICANEVVVFTANPSDAGANPGYKWYVNGLLQSGLNGNTFTTSSLADGDEVHVVLSSNSTCVTVNQATSGKKPIAVTPLETPSVAITPTSSSSCEGSQVTFAVASSAHGGNAPSYQWLVNNVAWENGTAFSTSALEDGDVVTVEMTSSLECVTQSKARATEVEVEVIAKGNPSIDIALATGLSFPVCKNTELTFEATAVDEGTSPSFVWRVDGVATGSGTTFSSSSLKDGASVTCQLTVAETCQTVQVTSDAIITDIDICTSVEDELNSESLTLYPNPASEQLFVEGAEGLNVRLLNGLGQELAVSSNGQFDVSNLPAGTYFVQMEQAGNIRIEKFVKR